MAQWYASSQQVGHGFDSWPWNLFLWSLNVLLVSAGSSLGSLASYHSQKHACEVKLPPCVNVSMNNCALLFRSAINDKLGNWGLSPCLLPKELGK